MRRTGNVWACDERSDTTTAARYQDRDGWEQLVATARWVRTWGDCYGYLLVATGQAVVGTAWQSVTW